MNHSVPMRRLGLLALAVATLVYFPLISSFAGENNAELMWRRQDTFDFIAAWTATLALAWLLLAGAARRSSATYVAVAAILLTIGFFFFAGALVKFRHLAPVVGYIDGSPVVKLLFAVSGLAAFALLGTHLRNVVDNAHRLAVLAFVPVFHLVAIEVNRPTDAGLRMASGAGSTTRVAEATGLRPLTVIALFDELSPEIYGARQTPVARTWHERSEVFSQAWLPGGRTGLAVPHLFNDQERGRPSLGSVLAAAGDAAFVRGWYLDYCAHLVPTLPQCESVGIFSMRTASEGFSLFNPLRTNLVVLPARMPFGIVKVPLAAGIHAETFAATAGWLDAAMMNPQAEIVYVHFNVPHTPYLEPRGVFGVERYVASSERYDVQLKLVDEQLSRIVTTASKLPDRHVRVIVISDHNLRALTPEEQHEHVTLLVRDLGDACCSSTSATRVHPAHAIVQRLLTWHPHVARRIAQQAIVGARR